MRRGAFLAALLAIAAACGPAAADGRGERIEGIAVALDGDTLLIGTTRVRLWGVSAPEMSDWPLGAWARATLDDLLSDGRPVRCDVVDRDRYKRPVAVCLLIEPQAGVAPLDLGLAMVAAGWAVPWRTYTRAAARDAAGAARGSLYDRHERTAREAGRGIWRGRPTVR